MKYTPLDELLARPRVKMLRVLRRCDWFDLYEACDIGAGYDVRNAFSCTLDDAVRRGEIERRALRGVAIKTGAACQYRITERGRRRIDEILTNAQPPAEDFADDPPPVLSGPKCKRCPRIAVKNGKLCAPHTEWDRERKRSLRARLRLGEGVAA